MHESVLLLLPTEQGYFELLGTIMFLFEKNVSR